MNVAIITGNLTADPEVRQTRGGAKVANFTVAVQRNFKNQQGTYDADFIAVQVWKGTAEYCEKYLKKGSKVGVEGSIQTRSYEAQDGSRRYVTEIIAQHVENLTPRQNAQGGNYEAAEKAAAAPFTEIDDDELPFK